MGCINQAIIDLAEKTDISDAQRIELRKVAYLTLHDRKYKDTPVFDKLPTKNTDKKNYTYAGIGSRETPVDILKEMTNVGTELDKEKYNLQSGGAIGADMAFEGKVQPIKIKIKQDITHKGNKYSKDEVVNIGDAKFNSIIYESNKKMYNTKDGNKLIEVLENSTSGTRTKDLVKSYDTNVVSKNTFNNGEEVRKIAEEIHPAPQSLGVFAKDLMARNTYQIFGDKLDKPVDFVLYYAEKDPQDAIRPKGGTGQAVEMAVLKGIPVINMADENWKEQLAKAKEGKLEEPDEYKLARKVQADRPKLDYSTTNDNSKSINVYSTDKTKYSKLSNLLAGPVTIKNKTFNTVEHAFQYWKASVAGTNKVAAQDMIMGAKDGYEAQKIGRHELDIDTNKWTDKVAYKALEIVMSAYYNQNKEAAKLLINTGDSKLTHERNGVEQDNGRFSNILTAIRTKLQGTESNSSTDVYTKLGDKTASGNVVVKGVYNKEGIKYAKSIGGVFSLRVQNSKKHFGNPFSSKVAGLIQTKSTKESVEKYLDWILSENTDIEPERHAWIREQIKSGVLKGKPIVYYKELGEPSHATALDYLINNHNWGTILKDKPKEEINQMIVFMSKEAEDEHMRVSQNRYNAERLVEDRADKVSDKESWNTYEQEVKKGDYGKYNRYSGTLKRVIEKLVNPKVVPNVIGLMLSEIHKNKIVLGEYNKETHTVQLAGTPTPKEVGEAAEIKLGHLYMTKVKNGTIDGLYKYVGENKKDTMLKILSAVDEVKGSNALTHEMIHAGSARFIQDNPHHPAVKRVKELYNEALNRADEIQSIVNHDGVVSTYWQTSVDEFVAEALSNPGLMQALSQIEVKDKNKISKGMLEELVNNLLDMLGLTKKVKNNLLEFTMNGFTAIMEAQTTESKKQQALNILMSLENRKQRTQEMANKLDC